MPIQKLNPAELFAPRSYSQVAVATGTRLVFLAGQVAVDAAGNVVGSDSLSAQAEQAYENVRAGLAACGATLSDIARLTLYVVDWNEAMYEQLAIGIRAASQRAGLHIDAPMTLIGVKSLASPAYLIEIEATAVVA